MVTTLHMFLFICLLPFNCLLVFRCYNYLIEIELANRSTIFRPVQSQNITSLGVLIIWPFQLGYLKTTDEVMKSIQSMGK